jgi:hypothetical protein
MFLGLFFGSDRSGVPKQEYRVQTGAEYVCPLTGPKFLRRFDGSIKLANLPLAV